METIAQLIDFLKDLTPLDRANIVYLARSMPHDKLQLFLRRSDLHLTNPVSIATLALNQLLALTDPE